MICKNIIVWLLSILPFFAGGNVAWADFVIHSQTAVKIELTGYDGLTQKALFMGDLAAEGRQEIDLPYRGLALLVFAGGQSYPVIIGDASFTLNIANPNEPPVFSGSGENDDLYKVLSGGNKSAGNYPFALLMIQAKDLLESTYAVHTVEDLNAKKKEILEFVGKHYESLRHSDMVRRLMAQYFMMHEYVDYHEEGAPADSIRIRYQKEVLDGVKSWLETLKPYLQQQDVLNFIVSLYYGRSMVSLAAQIIENFKDAAFCAGEERKIFSFPPDMMLTGPDGTTVGKFTDFKGNKIIAFVSEACPVSMVAAVSMARKLAAQKENVPVIVAPLEALSDKHLGMARNIRGGKLYFINDEKWLKENLATKIRLPLSVRIGAEANQ